jgi:serine/threonine-protein kinase HipA
VALALAKKAGIQVPAARVETVAKKPVLLLRRFDRDGKRRIPFLSAMSMLGAKDNETHSYLEIVDALRQHGAAPKADMEALWRRIVFNILISNTDTTCAITVSSITAATAGASHRPTTSTPCRPT